VRQAMWSVASMLSRTGRAWDPAHIAAIFKATGEAMAGKAEDRAQGLAERSVNTSIVHPTEGNPDRRIRDGRSASDRHLTENDQREGMEKTDPGNPKA
jgi:hypothetical protein